MKINRNNYEEYFIDYLEGNLGKELVDDFIEFLQKNLDLKEELSLFESITAESENIVFQHKEKLYKTKYDSEKEFSYAAVANMERDISSVEQKDFETYLSKHPEKQKEIKLFNHTKLQPDESITFQHKKKLYHRTPGRTVFLWTSRVAAVLVVALAIFWLTNEPTNNLTPQNQLAEVKDDTPKKEGAEEKPESSKKINLPAKNKTTPKTKETPRKATEKTFKTVPKKIVKPKTKKSLRETSKGRMGDADLALLRIPVEVPDKISPKTVSFVVVNKSASLAAMPEIQVPENKNPFKERLLADVVKEKTGLNHLSLNKITKAGLQLVSNISKDKFTYETNQNGKVTELNLDTRLLAFSIPTHNEEASE